MTREMEVLLLWLLVIVVIVIIVIIFWMWGYVARKPPVPGPTGPAGSPYFIDQQYGITGDNQTDWTSKLNAIVASAPSDGLSLVFPAGRYVLGSPWTVNKPFIQIQGLPGAVFVRKGTGNITLSASNCYLGGVTIDGQLLSGPGVVVTSSYVTLLAVQSTRNGGSGIHLQGADSCNIASCVSSGNGGNGITLLQSPDNRLFNNLVTGNLLNGINLVQSDDCILMGNLVDNNTKGDSTTGGVVLDASNYAIVDSHRSHGNASGAGIAYTNDTGASTNGVITGNQCNSNGGVGILLYYNTDQNYGTNYTNVSFNILYQNGNNTVLNSQGNVGNAVIDNITP